MFRIPIFLLALTSSALALDLHGRIQWNDQCSSLQELGRSIVILDDGKMYGGVTKDGRFTIPEVPVGTFVLSVRAHDHVFDQLRIDVHNTSDTHPVEAEVVVRPYMIGTPLNPAVPVQRPYPIVLLPRAKLVYFTPKESFNLITMFSNPMMLMLVVSVVLMLGMPYLMKNLDPEVLQEFQQRQAKMAKIQNSIQTGDFKAGLSAMLPEEPSSGSPHSKSEGNAGAIAKVPSTSATQSRNRKNKKR